MNRDYVYRWLDTDKPREVKVILTVHHMGIDKPDGTPGDRHDKLDVREDNLVALCQRCHLFADLDIHVEKARETRQLKKRALIEASGQLKLW
jgi:hypothetical protein